MNRLFTIIIMVLLSLQLYVMYSFWQMDKRFVDSTYQDLDKKTNSQYDNKGDNNHAL